jgi:hypothetical protein
VAVSSLNLACTILGAGMFALPRAFAGLGLLGGVLMLVAVAAMVSVEGKCAWASLLLRPYAAPCLLSPNVCPTSNGKPSPPWCRPTCRLQ